MRLWPSRFNRALITQGVDTARARGRKLSFCLVDQGCPNSGNTTVAIGDSIPFGSLPRGLASVLDLWPFGMTSQRCNMIMKSGYDLSISISSVTRSSERVWVKGFAKYDPDSSSAWPPGSQRKCFKAPLDPDRNDGDGVRSHNQADSWLKRLERSIRRP